MAAPGFWDDPDKAQTVAQEANNLKSEVETFHGLVQKLDDVETLWEMAMEEKDESLQGEIEEEVEGAKKTLADLELGMLLSDQYDANNAILTLHAREAVQKPRTGPRCCSDVHPVCRTEGVHGGPDGPAARGRSRGKECHPDHLRPQRLLV